MKIGKLFEEQIWDDLHGIGSVPDCANVNYKGFVKRMTIKRFFSLVSEPRKGFDTNDTIEYLKDELKYGNKIGRPFLDCEWLEDKKKLQIITHEGRHRLMALGELKGIEFQIEVCIFIRGGYRAKDITSEMRNAELLHQRKT